MELVVQELLLRAWERADLDEVWAALQDPAVIRWNGSGVDSREAAAEWLLRRDQGTSRVSRAVVDRVTGQLLGSVAVHSIDSGRAEAAIGYWVVPSARGRRVAPRAVDALVTWAFRALELDRVELRHEVANRASARVAERAGFTFGGRLRGSYQYAGVTYDELLWSRLSDDPSPAIGADAEQ